MIASVMSLLGSLVLEREPLKYGDLGSMVREWVQDAGGFAAIGLFIYVMAVLSSRKPPAIGKSSSPFPATEPPLTPMSLETDDKGRSVLLAGVLFLGALATLCYLAAAGLAVADFYFTPPDAKPAQVDPNAPPPPPKPPTVLGEWTNVAMTAGGAVALIGFCLPFLRDLSRLRLRRIWALARLSFQEAVRRKVLWVFLAFLLIFLFPPKWFFPIRLEDEVRTNVSVIYWTMTPLLLLTAGLLAAFAIPTDIRNQTIHTIVTKPVEKFEIVLGRFFGYVLLTTVVLGGLSAVSLLLIWLAGNVSEESKNESLKARVPVWGSLEFRGGSGESVGREWDYRKYIAGGRNSRQAAEWVYRDGVLPADLASKSQVPCEFAFDIFRTTKGSENKGIYVSFLFAAHQWGDPYEMPTVKEAELRRAYQDKVRGLDLYAPPGSDDWKRLSEIAEETGFYEYRSKEIRDYHTFDIPLPPGLFKAALAGQVADGQPRFRVMVRCDSPTQFLGVAKHDLYLLANDAGFAWNFLKGVYGLWLRLCLITAVAVACSTYLSGVISWLATTFLFAAGYFQDFIRSLADGSSVGGGPAESLLRLSQNTNLTVPLTQSAATTAAEYTDVGFRWILRRLLNVIPDVDRLNWSNYVAEGFNIDGVDIVLSTLITLGYLLPVAVLAYYLMKSREIAS